MPARGCSDGSACSVLLVVVAVEVLGGVEVAAAVVMLVPLLVDRLRP